MRVVAALLLPISANRNGPEVQARSCAETEQPRAPRGRGGWGGGGAVGEPCWLPAEPLDASIHGGIQRQQLIVRLMEFERIARAQHVADDGAAIHEGRDRKSPRLN